MSGSPTHWQVNDPILHIILYCFRLFPVLFQIFLIYMMSFLTVTHIPTRRNVLYPEPLGFKPKLRLSSKRTHLVQSTSTQCASQREHRRGAHRGASTTRRAAAAVLLAEKTVASRSGRTRVRPDRTRGAAVNLCQLWEGNSFTAKFGSTVNRWWGGGEKRCSSSPTQRAAQSASDVGDARRAGITAQQQQR